MSGAWQTITHAFHVSHASQTNPPPNKRQNKTKIAMQVTVDCSTLRSCIFHTKLDFTESEGLNPTVTLAFLTPLRYTLANINKQE